MFENSEYTGSEPNEFATNFIRALEAERFTVTPTHQGPVPGERKTLRIYWDDVYVGQMKADLWEADDPFVCLYRFEKDDEPRKGVAHAPHGFDKLDFARRNGCSPQQLHVETNEGKSYLLVRDAETALLLLRGRAKRIDNA